MGAKFIEIVKLTLLFAYGTTSDVARDHHPQSRAVAYTIGGLLVFVTLPFLFLGTVYLLHDEFLTLENPVLRWTMTLGAAALITTAVLWVERALLVLSDAIYPHFSAHVIMFLIRVGMVFLFSAVIAEKWVLNSYAGPILSEKIVMANEAQDKEKANATKAFNVESLGERLTDTQKRSRDLELKLATLPAEITSATARLNACQVESARLSAERSELRRIVERTAAQEDRLTVVEVMFRGKQTDCRLQDTAIKASVRTYREPIQTELMANQKMVLDLSPRLTAAESSAAAQASERIDQAAQALTMSGSDQEAFARVRAKQPKIDLEVRNKTLLLAALELLPLLLKLLTTNSPISMQARSWLQQESESFRGDLKESIARERRVNAGAKAGPVPSGSWGFAAAASPYVAPPPAPVADASERGYESNFQQ